MNEMQIFKHKQFGEIRTVELDGEPWFVGKDVADVLGYARTADAIRAHVDSEDKGVCKTPTPSGEQDMTIINESGLYSLILSSKLPNAKAFKRWVTAEVLPTIRKTGGYVSNDNMFIDTYLPFADDTTKMLFKSTLAVVREQNNLIEEQKKRIEVMQPKEAFFDAVAESKTAIEMGAVAKVLGIKGMGRNNLFEFLRNKKVLMWNNLPMQSFVDRGYFRIVETKYTKPNGDTAINIKTLVYQKGVDYIRKLVEKDLKK